MTKSQRLLQAMMESYPDPVSYKTLMLITPAYSQRFGEWRKVGIKITCESVYGGSYYHLKTHPEAIDAEHIELRQGRLL